MDSFKIPPARHKLYHAHIYFDATTLELALLLYKEIEHNFNLKLGKINKNPVGPHTTWSFEVTFSDLYYVHFVQWLNENRGSLNVLIHAYTGEHFSDHTDKAFWLGNEVKLNFDFFRCYI